MLEFGEVFAGIGGFSLGFVRVGMKCKWQVEIDEFCRRLLSGRFPDSGLWGDIRTFPDCSSFWNVDVLCGGFPCQDLSYCGKGAGIDGERSGLWGEFARIIRALGPRFVVVENVPALLARGMDRVLGDLAACGYDAEWDCLPASAFGAYHERDRLFILAYTARVDGRSHDLLEACGNWRAPLQSRRFSGMALAERGKRKNARLRLEPGLARLVRRVPGAVDRLEGIGDSIYPAVAEWLGRRIIEAAERGAA